MYLRHSLIAILDTKQEIFARAIFIFVYSGSFKFYKVFSVKVKKERRNEKWKVQERYDNENKILYFLYVEEGMFCLKT